MARIAGINLPISKCVLYGLQYVKGIGPMIAKRICTNVGINESKRIKDLTEHEVSQIRQFIEDQNIIIEGDLNRINAQNIKRLIETKSYRGMRHLKNLPVRGQRTKSNARTRRGKRKAIAGKKS